MKATHLSCSLAASALALAMLGGCSGDLSEETTAQAAPMENATEPSTTFAAPQAAPEYQEPTPAERRLQWVNKPFSSSSDEGTAAAAGTATTEAPASDSL